MLILRGGFLLPRSTETLRGQNSKKAGMEDTFDDTPCLGTQIYIYAVDITSLSF